MEGKLRLALFFFFWNSGKQNFATLARRWSSHRAAAQPSSRVDAQPYRGYYRRESGWQLFWSSFALRPNPCAGEGNSRLAIDITFPTHLIGSGLKRPSRRAALSVLRNFKSIPPSPATVTGLEEIDIWIVRCRKGSISISDDFQGIRGELKLLNMSSLYHSESGVNLFFTSNIISVANPMRIPGGNLQLRSTPLCNIGVREIHAAR